jgi:branched-chain amino acid transport system substrate-binding protein
MKKEASLAQAGDYSAALTYLRAVKAVGTDDSDKVMAAMKNTPIKDMFTANGTIRPDGRMVHDMYLLQVKKPAESKYPWDYMKVAAVIPGETAYMTKAESKCSYWK